MERIKNWLIKKLGGFTQSPEPPREVLIPVIRYIDRPTSHDISYPSREEIEFYRNGSEFFKLFIGHPENVNEAQMANILFRRRQEFIAAQTVPPPDISKKKKKKKK